MLKSQINSKTVSYSDSSRRVEITPPILLLKGVISTPYKELFRLVLKFNSDMELHLTPFLELK